MRIYTRHLQRGYLKNQCETPDLDVFAGKITTGGDDDSDGEQLLNLIKIIFSKI